MAIHEFDSKNARTLTEQTKPEAEQTNPCVLSPEVCEQLKLLDNTQNLLQVIVVGLALQFKALDVQRQMLLDNAQDPENFRAECYADPTSLRLGSSLITLSALLGFQDQSVSLAQQACAAGEQPDTVEPTLGALVILIALIRFFRLLQARAENANQQQNADQSLEIQLEAPDI